jgi:hypothetical protein
MLINTKKKLAVFDVDDTFYSLQGTIHRALTAEIGVDIHPSKWHSFMLNEVYGVTNEEIFAAFHKHDILIGGVVDHAIKDLLKHFKDEGYTTLALTSRGWHNEGERLTHQMLDANDIKFDHVQVVTHGQSKGGVLKDQWTDKFKVDFFIDDYEKNIHGVANSIDGNPLIVVKNQPWNKINIFDENKFKRVDHLSEVIELYHNHHNLKVVVPEPIKSKPKNKIKPR